MKRQTYRNLNYCTKMGHNCLCNTGVYSVASGRGALVFLLSQILRCLSLVRWQGKKLGQTSQQADFRPQGFNWSCIYAGLLQELDGNWKTKEQKHWLQL